MEAATDVPTTASVLPRFLLLYEKLRKEKLEKNKELTKKEILHVKILRR